MVLPTNNECATLRDELVNHPSTLAELERRVNERFPFQKQRDYFYEWSNKTSEAMKQPGTPPPPDAPDGAPTNTLYAILDAFPVADEALDTDARRDTLLPGWQRDEACALLAGEEGRHRAFSCARLAGGADWLREREGGFGARMEWVDMAESQFDLLCVVVAGEGR